MCSSKTLLGLGLLYALCLACAPPSPKTADAPVGSRKVVAPDRIYFKNLKASRYVSSDDHEQHRTAYIHKKSEGAPAGWTLRMVDDWLNDRSWLEMTDDQAALFYRLGAENEEMVLLKSEQTGNLEAMKTFADRLAAPYEICRREVAATVSDCLPGQSAYRLALRETIADYLRLTDAD